MEIDGKQWYPTPLYTQRHALFDVLRGTLSLMMFNYFWRPTAAGSLQISMLRRISRLETDRLTSLFCGSTRAVPARGRWQQVGCDERMTCGK